MAIDRKTSGRRTPRMAEAIGRFWTDDSGKARQAFSGITAIMFIGFIAVSLVMDFIDTGPSQSDHSSFTQDNLPTDPDPGYVWGLATSDEDIILDTTTVADDNIAIVLDFSGSMTEGACEGGGSKAWVAVNALESFLENVPAGVNMSLVAFDDSGLGEVVPMAKDNGAQIQSAVRSLVPGGSTPLGSAMEAAVASLERAASARLGNGSYKIVIITDGVADDEMHVLHEVRWANLNTPIMTYTAGFCIGTGHPLNQPGETVYASANNTASLLSVLEAAVAEAQDFADGAFDNSATTGN